MNRIVTLAIATIIIGTAWAGAATAQTAKDFVGTWTLVSATVEQGGVKSDTFGPDAKGVLVFDAGGRYVITFFFRNSPPTIGRAERPKKTRRSLLAAWPISVPIASMRPTKASPSESTTPRSRIGTRLNRSVLL